MRNYYAALETPRSTPMATVADRLQQLRAVDPAVSEKAESVMFIAHRKELYDKVHLQYEAIGLAYQAFKSEIDDTNDWDRRLVEFITPET